MTKKGFNWWPSVIIFFFITLVGGLVHIVYIGHDLFIPPVKDDFKTQQDFFQPESDRRALQQQAGLDLKMKVRQLQTGPNLFTFYFNPSVRFNNQSDTATFILYRVTGTATDQVHKVLPSTDSTYTVPVLLAESGTWFVRSTIPLENFDYRKEFRLEIR